MMEVTELPTCDACYYSFSGWWCDNCDAWPCECVQEEEDHDDDAG